MADNLGNLNQYGQNNPPGGPEPFSQEQALADIHAAMMEELGIGRKDTLPLQDMSDDLDDINNFAKTLKPRKALPGTTTWQNFKFDDVNPAEAAIDSIADGQLARIRRHREADGRNDTSYSRRNRTNPNKGYDSSIKNKRYSHPDKTSSWGYIRRDSPFFDAKKPSAGSSRDFPNQYDGSSWPQVYTNDTRRYSNRHSRVDITIARIRAAFKTDRSSELPKKSQTHSIASPQSQDNKNQFSSYQHIVPETKILSHRTSIRDNSSSPSNENTSFFIHSTTNPNFQTSANQNYDSTLRNPPPVPNNSGIGSNSNTKKSVELSSPPKAVQELVTENESTKNFVSIKGQSLPLKIDSGELASKEVPRSPQIRSPALALKCLGGLRDSRWSQNPTPDNDNGSPTPKISKKLAFDQYVIKELTVKFQKDKSKPQFGIVRIVRERGSGKLEIQLEQNDELFLRENISENSIFASDWKNPETAIVFKAVRKSEEYPTWRIYFKIPHLKDEFEKKVNDLRERQLEMNSKQVHEISPPISERMSPRQSRLLPGTNSLHVSPTDSHGNRSPSHKNDLISVDPLSKAYLTTPAFCDRINTDTLNEMSEIGGITPLINFSETENCERTTPHVGSFTQDLIDINDDLLIEGLCDKLTEYRSGTVLDVLSEAVVSQNGPSASLMTSEQIRNSQFYVDELKKQVAHILSQSEVYTQLPSTIADSYMADKATKILEKSLSERERRHTKQRRYTQQAEEVPVHYEEHGQEKEPLNFAESENSPSDYYDQPHHLHEWSQQSDFFKVSGSTFFDANNAENQRTPALDALNSNVKENMDLGTKSKMTEHKSSSFFEYSQSTEDLGSNTKNIPEALYYNVPRIIYTKEQLLELRSQALPFKEEDIENEILQYIGPRRVLRAGRPVKPMYETNPMYEIKLKYETKPWLLDCKIMHHQTARFLRKRGKNQPQEKDFTEDVSSEAWPPIHQPQQEPTREMESSQASFDLDILIKNMESMKLDTEPTNNDIKHEFLPTPPASAVFRSQENDTYHFQDSPSFHEETNLGNTSDDYPAWADPSIFSNEISTSPVYDTSMRQQTKISAALPPKIPNITGAGIQKGLKSSIWS